MMAISLHVWSDIDDTRRLTGGNDDRSVLIVRIAECLRTVLGKPEHVADVVRMSLPEHDGQRMVDLVVAGREQDVLAELESGAIDARRLLAEGEVDPDEW